MAMESRKALISVWEKTGVLELAKGLAAHGYEIVSSSGTAKHLEEGGIKVTELVDMTGLPAILGGRVKTLHPAVFGGILARRGFAQDDEDRKKFSIPLIDVVVCTLYPFEETAEKGADLDHLIEKIDIGGVSLIRAAAKNYYHVAVVTDIADYESVLEELEKKQEFSLEFKQKLALKAFRLTSSYDATIYKGLCTEIGVEDETEDDKIISLRKVQDLRYGENPHQKAALFLPPLEKQPFAQHSGKELSYNNLLDLGLTQQHERLDKSFLKATTSLREVKAQGVLAQAELAMENPRSRRQEMIGSRRHINERVDFFGLQLPVRNEGSHPIFNKI